MRGKSTYPPAHSYLPFPAELEIAAQLQSYNWKLVFPRLLHIEFASNHEGDKMVIYRSVAAD